MKREKPIKPSENELAILQVLGDKGPCTVKGVNEVLSQQQPTGIPLPLS